MSTPGRNDPCSCGSGRKYKYCCLHHAPPQSGGPISYPPPGEAIENDGPLSFPPPDEAIEDDGPAARLLKEFIAERGDKDFGSMEQLNAELKEFVQQGNDRPIEALEGLSPNQMNAVLYAPLNAPGIIKIADRVEAGTGVPVLMMLHEMRLAIEAGEDVSCTHHRELQPKLSARIYEKFRQMRPFDGLLERVRVRTETDVPIVHTARAVLEVSGHLRTYANKFILSSSCKKQLKKSGYSAIYPDIFRSYALDFNWAYWPSFYEHDPFQDFFCFTLFQLARRGDVFVSPADYAIRFYGAFPMIADDLVGDDESEEAMNYLISIFVIHVVVHFWGFFGLVEFGDSDPRSDDIPLVRSTPLFRELIQFPAGWLAVPQTF